MRWAARSDENQKLIVKFLRQHDWGVAVTSRLGDGFPDLLCAKMGFTALAEAKDGAKVPSKQKLTKPQVSFHAWWPGVVLKVTSPEDALSKLNAALVRSGACRLEDVNGLSS